MPEKAIQPSPWISIWVAPRRTIERILAAPPRQSLVLLLAALGAIASLFQHFFSFRLAGQLFHWPILLGFAALAIRGLLFATVQDPYLLVAVQVFDGITAAVFSVMIPLIVADVAFGSGHFNLAQGIVGTATGIGASLSTVLAGYVSDKFGSSVAFTGLAGVAAAGLAMIWFVMPETRRRT